MTRSTRAAGCSGFAAVLALVLLPAQASRAAGVLIPRDGSPPIRVESHRVTATIEDGLARTKVRQTFVNPNGHVLEAVYEFPLPENAALVDLAIEAGGRRLEGLLAERQEARQIYDAIVHSKKDPALVEQIGRSKFRLSVFPVTPDHPTVVEITYVECVPLVEDGARYVYPLALESKSNDPTVTTEDLTLSVTLKSSAPLVAIWSPNEGMSTHLLPPPTEQDPSGAHEARASFENAQASLAADLVVAWRVAAPEPTLKVHAMRRPGSDAYFAAILTPPRLDDAATVPRDITFVLDVSGSMEGEKLERAKNAANWWIDHVRERDRVNIILFSDFLSRFAPSPLAATPENRTALKSFVAEAEDNGGTDLASAIATAAANPAEPGRYAMTVLLTDGRPTVGETDVGTIVASAREATEVGQHIFAFGIGEDVDPWLLDGVATATGGTSEVIRTAGDIEARLQAFLVRTGAVAIRGLSISIDGKPIDDVLPRAHSEVFRGEQVVITGRYSGEGAQEVVVTGELDGAKLRVATTVDFGRRDATGSFGATVARDLYAKNRLAWLERSHRLRNGLSDTAYYAALDRGAYSTADEVVRAMIDVSLDSGVQCAHTSFLALLPEDRARVNPRDRVAIEEALRRLEGRNAELSKRTTQTADADADADVFEAVPTSQEFLAEPEGAGFNGATSIGGHYGIRVSARAGRMGSGSGAEKYGARAARAGGGATQKVVAAGSGWLGRVQESDGHWCGSADAGGDVGATALAVLSFLGSGNTVAQGKFKEIVRDGTTWLLDRQDPATGAFDPTATGPGAMRGQAIATLVMCELAEKTGNPALDRCAVSGLTFLVAAVAQESADSPNVRQPETLGFIVLALEAAREFDFEAKLPASTLAAAERVVDELVAAENARDESARTPTLTAIAILRRVFEGADRATDRDVIAGADYLTRHAPPLDLPNGARDFATWYFGTYATFQMSGTPWKAWEARMLDTIVKQQIVVGDTRGSWNPWMLSVPDASSAAAASAIDPDEADRRARVISTAYGTLICQVYYRYTRVTGAHMR